VPRDFFICTSIEKEVKNADGEKGTEY
jgi:hypothetical protein